MSEDLTREEVLAYTSEIVSAYVSNNALSMAEVPSLIESVFKTLSSVDIEPDLHRDRPQPAVPIKKSVQPDYLICLEDGKKLKMLKRHLKTAYNMSPAEYRERWGLPADYPMVAPSYAEKRSQLAKEIGLGTKT